MSTIFYLMWFIISIMFMSNITEMVINNLKKPITIKYAVSIKAIFSFVTLISFLLIGLFTNNWLIFVIFSIYYFIWMVVLMFIQKNIPKLIMYIHMILLLSICIFSLFISLNHFYFGYDLENLIKSLWNLK